MTQWLIAKSELGFESQGPSKKWGWTGCCFNANPREVQEGGSPDQVQWGILCSLTDPDSKHKTKRDKGKYFMSIHGCHTVILRLVFTHTSRHTPLQKTQNTHPCTHMLTLIKKSGFGKYSIVTSYCLFWNNLSRQLRQGLSLDFLIRCRIQQQIIPL